VAPPPVQVAPPAAPVAGRISVVATEPRRDRGDMLVRIITNSDD
jgi:hypothetical protein